MLAPTAPTITPGATRIIWSDDYHINEWDAEFCRHARTDVPELARRLKKACEKLREVHYELEHDPYYVEHDSSHLKLAEELESIPEQ